MRTIIAPIFLVACILTAIADRVSSQVTCNLFELSTGINGETVSLTLSCDLPDATRVAVEVSQRYWRKNKNGVYSLEYLATERSVGELKAGLKVDVSQAARDKVMKDVQDSAEFAGRGRVEISELDPRYKVKVMLTMSQGDKSFGEFNKKLEGKAVIQDNEYRGARIVRFINADGKEEERAKAAAQVNMVKAKDFEAGKCYVLRRKIDVISHPKRAGRGGGWLAPEAGIVYIDRRVEEGEWVWFRLAVALAPDREPMIMGWARHDAFDIKKHREIQAPGFLEKLEATGFMTEGEGEKRWRSVGPMATSMSPDGVMIASQTVEIADGLDKVEFERQARMAAWEEFESWAAGAAVMKLQREGDTEPRAGEVWILPRSLEVPEALSGVDLRELSRADVRTQVRMDPSYLRPRPKALALETKVILKEEGSFEVMLWADPLTLAGERIARIAGGSLARVKAIRYLDQGEAMILRYEVEDENGKRGWVAAETVKPL